MAKFGLFYRGTVAPTSEYEGEFLTAKEEFVQIRVPRYPGDDEGAIVAAIYLEPGWDVRKLD